MPLALRIRLAVLGAATSLAAALVAPPAAEAAAPGDHSTNARRAQASWAALQRWFAVPDGSGLYREQFPVAAGDGAYSYEWPFSQAHVAALDLTGMSGAHSDAASYVDDLAAHDAAQLHYWTPASTTGLPGFASGAEPPFSSGGDLFYDDNEWVGLQDVQHYLQHGDAASLDQARQIFDLVMSGWDSDPAHADPGGIFWTQAPWSQDRNTVSNMPAAELGLRLYSLTHEQRYLDGALRSYRWTNANLRTPEGLYYDHVDLQGNVEKTIWSYNQGVPVGVNVLLYEVTHDKSYLQEAQRIASAALAYYAQGGRLDAQPPFFNSIFFKNLLLLSSVKSDSAVREALVAYADRLWTQHRDPATGLFRFGDAAGTQMIEQAAVTQVFAVLAWSRGDWSQLY
ncbi:glycosyl hydrolase family 76 [Motilibacter peucedani]|uniref:Glycosyl hydrolase family 76 n=1 Tax=Motilibacter peucedani TaxID=598650 RepID=A0A420XTM5_9ACTN|nr:glycoside hydrolase family 76 protein [Motilibacter peucedani]RKS80212.1 glycosyl hydrolase family 76 [Motilibacter peucedani]